MNRTTGVAICVLSVLVACGEEPPPRSVTEFMDDPILLEATIVRCGQDRAASRYDAECVNARDAVDRLAAAREQARRAELEARSEQKRQALRRAQQAAAEARRRAQEARQRREEAEYYGEFEPLPPGDEQTESPQLPEPARDDSPESALHDPPADAPPDEADDRAGDTSLEAVREELKRRQDEQQE
jgi:multidrug efflux pump subunit AcrA (membrane-fusion protein)